MAISSDAHRVRKVWKGFIEVPLRLGVALAIGLVIGVERGWKVREAREGERVAGVRTYGLIGLLGGGMALVAERLGPLPLALAFVALAGVLDHGLCDHCRARRRRGHYEPSRRASGLRIRCAGRARPGGRGRRLRGGHDLLLGFKPVLHRWVSALEGKELRAALKLLLISVVLLPILPDRGYGLAGPESLPDLVDGGIDRGDLLRRLFRHQARGRPQGRGDRELVRRSSLVHGLDPALLADGTPRT